MAKVRGQGSNNMPRNWIKEDKLNYRIYRLWQQMFDICRKNQDVCICERWLKLSNFVEDIYKLENFELWEKSYPTSKVCLIKGIKSIEDKSYCADNCKFILQDEHLRKNNEKRKRLVARYDLNNNLIDIKTQVEFKNDGFSDNCINMCCNGRQKTHKGYVFKYYEE